MCGERRGGICKCRRRPAAVETPAASGAAVVTGLRPILRWLAAAGVAVGLVAIAGLIRFAIPPAAETGATPTDAIVVLTGGSLRLQSGVDLMREGKGRELFVSGVDQRVDREQLLRALGDPPPWLSCCIAIGYEAENTAGNAQETALWMRRRGYRSLRLVTAWYHMPRGLLEFARAMPEIEIVAHPVFPERVKPQQWWAWRGTAGLLIGEYAKYLAALFRPLVERPRPPGAEPVAAEARR